MQLSLQRCWRLQHASAFHAVRRDVALLYYQCTVLVALHTVTISVFDGLCPWCDQYDVPTADMFVQALFLVAVCCREQYNAVHTW